VADNITVGVESKAYAYSLALPNVKGVSLEDLDLEEMEIAVEAFELQVDNLITLRRRISIIGGFLNNSRIFDDTQLSRIYIMLRREHSSRRRCTSNYSSIDFA
jgi:hypothetical protein